VPPDVRRGLTAAQKLAALCYRIAKERDKLDTGLGLLVTLLSRECAAQLAAPREDRAGRVGPSLDRSAGTGVSQIRGVHVHSLV